MRATLIPKPVLVVVLGLVSGGLAACQAIAVARPIGSYRTPWHAGPGYAYTQPYEYSDPMLPSPGPTLAISRASMTSGSVDLVPAAIAQAPHILTDPPVLERRPPPARDRFIGGGPPRRARLYDPAIVIRTPPRP